MAASETWSDPNRCPFCDQELVSPGKGFVVHINESPECDADFDLWRERVSGDISGGWSR